MAKEARKMYARDIDNISARIEKKYRTNNPKGNNQHTSQELLVKNQPIEEMSKEEMYSEIREMSQVIIKYEHLIRPLKHRRANMVKKYFEIEE